MESMMNMNMMPFGGYPHHAAGFEHMPSSTMSSNYPTWWSSWSMPSEHHAAGFGGESSLWHSRHFPSMPSNWNKWNMPSMHHEMPFHPMHHNMPSHPMMHHNVPSMFNMPSMHHETPLHHESMFHGYPMHHNMPFHGYPMHHNMPSHPMMHHMMPSMYNMPSMHHMPSMYNMPSHPMMHHMMPTMSSMHHETPFHHESPMTPHFPMWSNKNEAELRNLPVRPCNWNEYYSMSTPIKFDMHGNRFFSMAFDMHTYKPEEVEVCLNKAGKLVIKATMETVADTKSSTTDSSWLHASKGLVKRTYYREVALPEELKEVKAEHIKTFMTAHGWLCVEVPLPTCASSSPSSSPMSHMSHHMMPFMSKMGHMHAGDMHFPAEHHKAMWARSFGHHEPTFPITVTKA